MNIHETNRAYWDEVGNDALQAVVLPQWGASVFEEQHHLLGDISGRKLLEIGCGNGQSLMYNMQRGANELWGIDISSNQLARARRILGDAAHLICSPMEADCGIPVNYFDIVYSVYAIGWATDLSAVFQRISAYLKPGGIFVFSWSHPIHKCVNQSMEFIKSYFDENWYDVPQEFCGGALRLCDRKLSTYINALTKAGLIIEEMHEGNDSGAKLSPRAAMLPMTMVIKARKA